jgi:hypothetical protein
LTAIWSSHDGHPCVRVRDVPAGVDLRVRPAGAAALGSAPGKAGRVVRAGGDVCFVPRFGFIPGTEYVVSVDGAAAGSVRCPGRDVRPTTEVLAIHPTAAVVPRNLLRCYVTFSSVMAEGDAAAHVSLVSDDGPLPAALLRTEYELWDADRRRLTVLLDPARIKRGLVGHRELGYPLRTGMRVRLRVDRAFRDATGTPLAADAEREYQVGGDLRGQLDPAGWRLTVPPAGTRNPLVVGFDRPLDHALLDRCLAVDVPGRGRPCTEDREWTFTPDEPWQPVDHRLAIDPVLEDVAGNSVGRVFDRDLTRDVTVPPTTVLGFRPAG